MILLIDNYDSFVHNLARYIRELGFTVEIQRNDALTVQEVEALNPSHIILSPGPGTPLNAGICIDLIHRFAPQTPILGVCLGHQAIGQAYGADIIQARNPTHGKASLIEHDGQGLFEGMPNPLRVGRYHSLAVSKATLPASLKVTAKTSDGEIMAIQHQKHPLIGVQFHPESILTDFGHQLLINFFNCTQQRAGMIFADDVPEELRIPKITVKNT